MTAALVTRSTVRELVRTFVESEAAIRAAFAAIVAAEDRLNSAFALGERDSSMHVSASRNVYDSDFRDADRAVDRLARSAWASVIERLELRKVMSVKAWDDLQKQLDKGELPPLTEDNVFAFAENCASNMGDMLRDAVVEVFDWLRPAGYWDGHYKTNDRYVVGRKVIRPWSVETQWTGRGFRVRYDRAQNLTALERVFLMLDGRGTETKGYQSDLQMAIEASPDGTGETDYFRFRCFKNGNLHLEIKRLDLLRKFNQIAGGKHLREEDGRAART